MEEASTYSGTKLRDAMQALRERGLTGDVDELVRVGAAAMVLRCLDAFDDRDVSTGWLVSAIRAGGTWESTQPRRSSPADLIRKLGEAS